MSHPPSVVFSHVGIFVADTVAMENFYTGFLGFVVTDRGNLGAQKLVFLSRDPREHHQVVLVSGRPADSPFNVINQLSFRVENLAALREFHRRAQDAKLAEIAPVTHGNAVSLYFRDPEGNRIELYMDTPWYAQQPQRIPVDLSLDDEALWKSIEEKTRVLPDFKSQAAWQAEIRRRMETA